MKCPKCLRKPGILKCKDCSGCFCSGCIQLEIHACPNLSARKEIDRNKLQDQLIIVKASKILKF